MPKASSKTWIHSVGDLLADLQDARVPDYYTVKVYDQTGHSRHDILRLERTNTGIRLVIDLPPED